MALLKSIATVGGYTMISRVLGFVRDILVAATLGAGMVADAFFVAFKIPNLFRRLFAEGAFSAAFVPLYAGELEEHGPERAKVFADQAFALLLWILLGFVIVIELAMPWVMMVLAPGFLDTPGKFDLAVELTRITFPYLLLISLVSLMSGMLNSLGKFAAAAATPILLNLCLIGAVLGLTPLAETPGHALAWGVFAAGVVQLIWLYFNVHKAGVGPSLVRPTLTPIIRLLFKRILPVAVGAGIYQISLAVDMIIASFLPEGSISFLFYADRVNQLPLGVVGVAVGTALLPLLARQVRAGELTAAAASQNRAIEFSLLLTLPAAAALIVINQPVISVLFERGAFDAADTQATAAALSVYAMALPAYVLVKALGTVFFAREDTKTPVIISCTALAINVAAALLLMGPFLHVGIAMAAAISGWVNALALAFVLVRRGQFTLDDRFKHRLPRIVAATSVMAAALWGLDHVMGAWLNEGSTIRVGGLTALIAAGLVVYALACHVFGAATVSDLKSLRRRR